MNVLYADARLGSASWIIGDPGEAEMGVPRELIECVCYLCAKIGGEWRSGGTAFFVNYPGTRSSPHLYVVTARHSLKEIKRLGGEVGLRINTVNGGAIEFTVKADWFYPDSEAVDLAVLPLDLPVKSGLLFQPFPALSIVREDRFLYPFSPGDELLITGLFSMRKGTQKNYPIVRAGVLAAMLDEPLEDEDGKPFDAYLAEVRSIGGLSGSPVFVGYRPPAPRTKNPGGFNVRDVPVMAPQTYYLLGLIRGHWDLKGKPVPLFDNELAQVNMGIAMVTPAQELHKLLHSERLEEDRRNREKERAAENAPTLD